MEDRIKILQIVPSLSQANGVAACVCNYFKYINKDRFDVTFAVLADRDHGHYKEIENNGGHIVELFRKRNIFKYAREINHFFKENKFDIIHCNVANTGLIFLYYAKKYGVKIRILHSHATMTSDKFLKRVRNNIILRFTRKLATHYFACSEAAGKSMFGNSQFYVIHNGIEYEKFRFNEEKRKQLRVELGINNELVLGNIGRIAKQKNQKFLIDVLKEIDIPAKLIIVGNGPLEDYLKSYAKKNNLLDRITFTGSIKNSNEIYNAFDVFLLPSIYEGLPVVGIEAQANGLPCIFSDRITKEVQINDNVIFEKLDIIKWKEDINKISRTNENNFYNSRYNIEKETSFLEEKYIELSGDNDVI